MTEYLNNLKQCVRKDLIRRGISAIRKEALWEIKFRFDEEIEKIFYKQCWKDRVLNEKVLKRINEEKRMFNTILN